MHEFSLWAPKAKKIAVKIDDKQYPMAGPDEKGWWKASVEAAQPGTHYAFMLDDDATPYPDPRGLWQPDGVHCQRGSMIKRRLHGPMTAGRDLLSPVR